MSSLVRPVATREVDLLARVHRLWRDARGAPSSLVVDLRETPTAWLVSAELDGVRSGDVKVTIDGDVLVIAVRRSFGRVSRSFAVPELVDRRRVTAAYDDGVLRVTLPKG